MIFQNNYHPPLIERKEIYDSYPTNIKKNTTKAILKRG
jgi:hypothetical protein